MQLFLFYFYFLKCYLKYVNYNLILKTVFMPKEQKNSQQGNAMAILSYLGILVIIPLLVAKDDEFVRYHSKQGLVLLVVGVVGMFIGVIPIIGWLLAPFITLAWLIFAIMGIINVLKGKKKELPIIGQYAEKFDI